MAVSALPSGSRGVTTERLERVGVGAPSTVVRQVRICSLSAVIDQWRSPGVRASARMTTFWTSRGSSGRSSPIGRGSSVAFLWSTSIASSPAHGGQAVSIS